MKMYFLKFILMFTFVFTCFVSNLFAQDDKSNKSVKLYMNASVNSNYYHTNGLDAFYLTPSFRITTKKGHFMEFEVSHMKFRDYNIKKDDDRKISGSNVKELELFLRYEYAFTFLKAETSRWSLGMGFSGTPFVQHRVSTPTELQRFGYSTTNTGAYFSVIPRVEYFISERWFLDLNFPISGVSVKYTVEKTQNPIATLKQRTVSNFDFEGMTSLGIRLGIGVVL